MGHLQVMGLRLRFQMSAPTVTKANGDEALWCWLLFRAFVLSQELNFKLSGFTYVVGSLMLFPLVVGEIGFCAV